MTWQIYRKKPIEVQAVRYGKDDDGRWFDGATRRIALFMLGRNVDEDVTEAEMLGVIKPTSGWNETCSLLMWDGVAHLNWLPLCLGDYVIKGVQGEFYPCTSTIFDESYEVLR